MTTKSDRAVDEYMRRLERSLRELPSSRRREIVSEIEEHLAATLAELEPEPTEADVRNALDRVGDPDDIAADARERFGIRYGRSSWTDPLAIVLLLVGGFLWLVGWIAGVVLLWLSDVWNTRDKIIGTLVIPGGLVTPLAMLMFGYNTTTTTECVTERRPSGVTLTTCGSGLDGVDVLALLLLVTLVVAPIGTAVYLGRKLRRARRASF